ncbi:hypothetical protein B0H16DRAFT_1632244 [Mycena metata]|uniref:Uncharacterized protein n=1 Tax=Mycena metata TaxID=1033252 RepID=A0AAD7GZJ9_9AGAR|nr:hypothetical protein B0H16DRAFT_1632244 [Mycena metata]
MLLGQFVTISVASSLFYLALPWNVLSLAPVALWLLVLLSLGTVAMSPFTSERSFLPNLLLMHTFIILPLLVPDRLFPLAQASAETKSRFGISLKTLYMIVFSAALVLHARATGQAAGDPPVSVRDLALKAWNVLHSHPAQSSIGWDVIWTSILFVVWLILHPELQPRVLPSSSTTRGRFLTTTYLLMATPLLSVGVLAPHVFWTT